MVVLLAPLAATEAQAATVVLPARQEATAAKAVTVALPAPPVVMVRVLLAAPLAAMVMAGLLVPPAVTVTVLLAVRPAVMVTGMVLAQGTLRRVKETIARPLRPKAKEMIVLRPRTFTPRPELPCTPSLPSRTGCSSSACGPSGSRPSRARGPCGTSSACRSNNGCSSPGSSDRSVSRTQRRTRDSRRYGRFQRASFTLADAHPSRGGTR
jgi:hypothetical protein